MNQIQRDQRIYLLAKEYLAQFKDEGVTTELLEKYLRYSEINPRPNTIQEIYKRILESAQNANMKSGVIGGAIGGIDKLSVVLCSFQPKAVINKYRSGWEQILDDIEKHLKPRGKMRRNPNSIWPHYCKTILSAAVFISQFVTADDFYRWVDFFDQDERARPALPMLLSCEIDGFGFALASDFLKELGYVNFAKPDIHIKDIFTGLELCPSKVNDYQVFRAVIRVAENVGVTPYNVDKLFWLIGSGKFYDDQQIGKGGRIATNKREFIAYAQQKLKLEQ